MQIYSNCVHFVGIEVFKSFFEKLKNFNLPIISVGSGNGLIEKNMDDTYGTDIICIDPHPLSWSKEKTVYKKPKYNLVSDIVVDKYKNNCSLILNWSSFEPEYDIESIRLLIPKYILVATETGIYRGASSSKIHNFIQKMGINTFGHLKLSMSEIISDDPNSEIDFNTKYKILSTNKQLHFNTNIGHWPSLYKIILMEQDNSIKLNLDNMRLDKCVNNCLQEYGYNPKDLNYIENIKGADKYFLDKTRQIKDRDYRDVTVRPHIKWNESKIKQSRNRVLRYDDHIEKQAIGRVVRLGQKQEIKTYKYIDKEIISTSVLLLYIKHRLKEYDEGKIITRKLTKKDLV